MSSEQLTVLAIVFVIVGLMVALMQLSKSRNRIRRVILGLFNSKPDDGQGMPQQPEQTFAGGEPEVLSADESEAELQRLQKLVDDRKQVAWNSDISHHLWGLYKNLAAYASPRSLDRYIHDNEWYDVKILHVSTQNGLNEFEFELKGDRYRFVDDEEKQGWREHTKLFSLSLYDDAGRCLIEIPMKMKVDKIGRNYSILPGGPNAFLLGGWINDFINVKLKHQSIRNQEIRAQKHRERLSEIEDLKDRFGISD